MSVSCCNEMMEVAFKTNKRTRFKGTKGERERSRQETRPSFPSTRVYPSGLWTGLKEGTRELRLLLILLTDKGFVEDPFLSHVPLLNSKPKEVILSFILSVNESY